MNPVVPFSCAYTHTPKAFEACRRASLYWSRFECLRLAIKPGEIILTAKSWTANAITTIPEIGFRVGGVLTIKV